LRIACAANFGVAEITNTSAPDAFSLTIWESMEGDYSYGIYLYGFPIQQALVEVFPTLKAWWALFPAAARATTALAMISWHLIERPALALKRIVTPLHGWRPAS
jgi:peptidoglycan/LPS O-acetylase OafA/YrhL